MTLATIAITMACISICFSVHSVIMARRSNEKFAEAQQRRHDAFMAERRQQT